MKIGRFLAIAMLSLALTSPMYARSTRPGRPRYSGGKHTAPHGGTYVDGQGSSHKNGTYHNPAGQHVYGTHKWSGGNTV